MNQECLSRSIALLVISRLDFVFAGPGFIVDGSLVVFGAGQ